MAHSRKLRRGISHQLGVRSFDLRIKLSLLTMGILSLIGLCATDCVSTCNNRSGKRMFFTAVQAFQREVSFVRRRNFIGEAKTPTTIWQLASSMREGGNKIVTNQEILERRLATNRGKKAARERSAQERVNRNLNIKRLLHSNTTSDGTNTDQSSFQIPKLYAIKVWVDDELRDELKLSGREKRGRVFIEAGSEGTKTFRGMKDEMFGFFRALRKNTFLLTANLPRLDENGNVIAVVHSSDDNRGDILSWKIESDEDVVKTFAMADEYFQNSTTSMSSELKRPSVQINVRKDPDAPLPPPPPSYLYEMPDPTESESMTMLSFYAFPPSGIADAEEFALDLKRKWKPFQALGRIYVATEGVNAQMSVPTNVLPNFMDCCRSIPELGQYMENDINIDPKPLSQDEFSVAGVPINGKPAPPFRNLHIRVRSQVVADGLDKSLDWQSAGYDMPPMEWHEQVKRARDVKNATDKDDSESPILLDCRNTYETDVGIFEGAEPLGTDSFRDSWDVLKDRLADTPKDAPIMTYCTGGIRCKYKSLYRNETDLLSYFMRFNQGLYLYA